MPSDIEIAQAAKMQRISKVALDKLGIAEDHLEPYGSANPAPVFCSRQLIVKGQPSLLGKDTLKFLVTDGQTTVSAVGFGMGSYRESLSPGQQVDVAYEVIIDDWNKAPTVQLKLRDIRASQ